METFSTLLALCVGNSPVTGEFPAQGPVTQRFDVFFDLRLNKGLSKQSWGWWFETPSRSLWRQRNAKILLIERSHKISSSRQICNKNCPIIFIFCKFFGSIAVDAHFRFQNDMVIRTNLAASRDFTGSYSLILKRVKGLCGDPNDSLIYARLTRH